MKPCSRTGASRLARGGARRGTPGANYPNRTDLHGQTPKAAPGGQYGEVKALLDAQKVIPLPTANQPPVQQASPAQAQTAPTMAPGDLNFEAPTQRPSEPVTAGLPVGPGPGPEALNLPNDAATTAMQLRALYANVPAAQNNDFLRLVELAEQQAWR
jgi:hypothetical protein